MARDKETLDRKEMDFSNPVERLQSVNIFL